MIVWHIIAIVLIFWIGWIFGRRMQNKHHWKELNSLRHYYEKKEKSQKNGTQEKYIRGTITKRKGAHWKDCAPFPTDPERSRR